jgi:hypothetical protein
MIVVQVCTFAPKSDGVAVKLSHFEHFTSLEALQAHCQERFDNEQDVAILDEVKQDNGDTVVTLRNSKGRVIIQYRTCSGIDNSAAIVEHNRQQQLF